jgi:osmoprotectant transport system permease protein
MLRNRVLLVLDAAGLAAAIGLPFVTHAPNRLVSGRPIPLGAALDGPGILALLPAIILLAGAFLPRRRRAHAVVAAAAAAFFVALVWLAGAEASALAEGPESVSRTSFGGAFWVLLIAAALALIDAMRRLDAPPASAILVGASIAGAVALLAFSGALDQLSIAKEFANRRDVFSDALARHVVIVTAALGPTLVFGAPLGILAHRQRRLRAALFPVLNIVQTIPSIALFGMLIAPLSGLVALFPGLAAIGVGGIGLAPAVIALVLYSLLPIVRNITEGLAGVSPAAIEAARGMGMSARQVLWRVELPLALPVFLSGLRVTVVQAIGLAAVAALIGAGGLGAIMFQGLFANALDLVLLGAVPVILLAVAADALLTLLTAYAERRPA